MEETISLQDILKTIRKHPVLIVLVTILAITITGLISYLMLAPVYQMSTEILVNQRSAETDQLINQNIQTDLQLINTYSDLIESPLILDQVVNELDLDMTSDQLDEKITVSNAEQSQIMNIAVRHEDPEVAVEIANTAASVFETEIMELMNVDNVNIIYPAALKGNPVPVSPNPMLNMAVAAIVGLMLGVIIAFLLEYLDTTMKEQQEVKDILGIPLLGTIPPIVEKAEIGQEDKKLPKGGGG